MFANSWNESVTIYHGTPYKNMKVRRYFSMHGIKTWFFPTLTATPYWIFKPPCGVGICKYQPEMMPILSVIWEWIRQKGFKKQSCFIVCGYNESNDKETSTNDICNKLINSILKCTFDWLPVKTRLRPLWNRKCIYAF